MRCLDPTNKHIYQQQKSTHVANSPQSWALHILAKTSKHKMIKLYEKS